MTNLDIGFDFYNISEHSLEIMQSSEGRKNAKKMEEINPQDYSHDYSRSVSMGFHSANYYLVNH